MISDSQIAKRLVDLYAIGSLDSDLDLDFKTFALYEPGSGDSGICWAADLNDGVWDIYLRGSVTLLDWIRDLYAFTIPFSHAVAGPVHPGFAIGMDRMCYEMTSKTAGLLSTSPVKRRIHGHSLGAGRARILIANLIEIGQPPIGGVCFGEPKAGFSQLGRYISSVPDQRSYRNNDGHHHDLVTDAPVTFGIEDYVHPVTLTDVCQAPDATVTAKYGIFGYHHMPLYMEALAKI
jgi:hypothetical protein